MSVSSTADRPRINVTSPSLPPFEEYVEELRGIWESKWITNRGSESLKFESLLKEYLGVDQLYCFANGHMALETAISGIVQNDPSLRGKEVITTPYTHISTTHSITRNGLTPVFADIKEEDLTIDPLIVEEKISDNTIAILATHVYGFPCDIEALETIAEKYKLYLIFDAAHAFGVRYNGRGIGTYGNISMFSTHATKVFQTIEGGIVTYNNVSDELIETISSIVNFGYITPEDITYIGTNARMNEFEAAMGVCSLRHFPEELAKRKLVAERYYEWLEGIPGISIPRPRPGTEWNYSYFPVLFEEFRLDRDAVQRKLLKENIYARKYFTPLTNQAECYGDTYGDQNVPVAAYKADHVLTLPLYADLSTDSVDEICRCLLEE